MPTVLRALLHGQGLFAAPHHTFGTPPEQQEAQALALYFASTALGAVMSVFGKICAAHGMHYLLLVLARSIVLCLLLTPVLYQKRVNPFAMTETFGLLLLRGFFGFSSLSLWYLSLNLLPLSDAYSLSFVSPVLVALLAPLVLGERTPPAVYFSMPLCVAGMLMVAQPSWLFGSLAGATSTLGVLAGIAQAFLSTGSKLVIRALNRHNEPLESIMASMGAFSLLGSALGCLVLPGEQLVAPQGGSAWGYLAATSLLAVVVQATFTTACRKCSAAKAASLDYLSLLWTLLADALVFHKLPSSLSLAGAAVITVASLGTMLWSWKARASGAGEDTRAGAASKAKLHLEWKREHYLGAMGGSGKPAAALSSDGTCSDSEDVSLIKAAEPAAEELAGSAVPAAGTARILDKIAFSLHRLAPGLGVIGGGVPAKLLLASCTSDSSKSWQLGTVADAVSAAGCPSIAIAQGTAAGTELDVVSAVPAAIRTSSEKEQALQAAGK